MTSATGKSRPATALLAALLFAACTVGTAGAASSAPAAPTAAPAAAPAPASAQPQSQSQPKAETPAAAPSATAPEKAPAAAAALNWRQLSDAGYRQLDAGDLPAALASFEAALRLNPYGAAAKTGKGIVLARQGKLDQAKQLLREALVLNPDPTRTHYELGRIYQRQGDYQRAIDEFKQGIEKYREIHP